MPSAAALRLTIERSLERRFPAALTPAPRALREVAATGIAEIDAYLDNGLGGGLPVGAISELTGPQSSGRTSLALAFLARRTAEGRACAWVDANDAFDPESAGGQDGAAVLEGAGGSAGYVPVGHVDVTLTNDGKELTVKVRDDGLGLPDDFDITKTTSLGLSIVRDLVVSQLEGRISMRSMPKAEGGGTRVVITVPLRAPR